MCVCGEGQWLLAQGHRVTLSMQVVLCEELSPAGSLSHSLKIPADLQWVDQSRSRRKAVVSAVVPWWSVTCWIGASGSSQRSDGDWKGDHTMPYSPKDFAFCAFGFP